MSQCHIQLGKQGITNNFICTLKSHFESHNNVKISVLKSARDHQQPASNEINQISTGYEKSKVKKYSEEILEKLGKNYTAKIIGFTIFLKRWRKAMRA